MRMFCGVLAIVEPVRARFASVSAMAVGAEAPRLRRDSKEDKAAESTTREGVRLAVVAMLVMTAVLSAVVVAQHVVGEVGE